MIREAQRVTTYQHMKVRGQLQSFYMSDDGGLIERKVLAFPYDAAEQPIIARGENSEQPLGRIQHASQVLGSRVSSRWPRPGSAWRFSGLWGMWRRERAQV
jgi:hypothetical protein